MRALSTLKLTAILREHINAGLIKTNYVKTSNQLANIFTKPFGVGQHLYLAGKLGLNDIFRESVWGGVLSHADIVKLDIVFFFFIIWYSVVVL